MPATSDRSTTGYELRAARNAVGLTRARLAALADCSLASLAGIEAGAVPRHSEVLNRALAVIAEIESDRSAEAA